MYASLCVDAQAGVFCLQKPEVDVGFLSQLFSILFFETRSLIDLGGHQLDRPASEGGLKDALISTNQSWHYSCLPSCLDFTRVLGIQTQVLGCAASASPTEPPI